MRKCSMLLYWYYDIICILLKIQYCNGCVCLYYAAMVVVKNFLSFQKILYFHCINISELTIISFLTGYTPILFMVYFTLLLCYLGEDFLILLQSYFYMCNNLLILFISIVRKMEIDSIIIHIGD